MDESNPLEEIKTCEHPPWYGSDQFEEKVTLIFLENQKSLFHHLTTRFRMPVKRSMTVVHVRKLHIPPSRWTQSQALLAERRIIPYSTEVHWRIQNYSYEFGCQARETHRWFLECWWVKRPVGSLDRFHSIYFIGRKTSRRKNVVRERLTRKQQTSRPDHLWPVIWKTMGKIAKLKEKQKWSNEKLHLENARKLRGICFIDPEDKEFTGTIKNARKKLDTSVALAMPCKIMKKNCGSGASNKLKTRLACILEADESKRLRMGESLPNHVEDHIAGNGNNSLQHYNLVHKFIPKPQAIKIPAPKAAVDKEWEQLEKISAWNLTKVRSKKRGDRWSKDVGRKSSLCIIDGHMSFEKCWVGGKAPKVQRSSCTPRWYCKRRFRVLRSIHRTRIISISNDSSKSHGYHLQIARLRWTSSGRSICFYPSKNGRCPQIIENSGIGMFRHLDSSTTTQMA